LGSQKLEGDLYQSVLMDTVAITTAMMAICRVVKLKPTGENLKFIYDLYVSNMRTAVLAGGIETNVSTKEDEEMDETWGVRS